MTSAVAGVALLAWLIGVVVLGTNWAGAQVAPGVWVDGVSLRQWFACWALLALLGAAASRYLRGWWQRVLSLLPLICWISWELSDGALGPIPIVIYVVPTTVVWAGAIAAGSAVGGARRITR